MASGEAERVPDRAGARGKPVSHADELSERASPTPRGVAGQAEAKGGRRPNRARRILLGATVVGALLIFGATLSQQLELARLERACAAGAAESCFQLCFKAPAFEQACAQVERACERGSAAACEAQGTLARRAARRAW